MQPRQLPLWLDRTLTESTTKIHAPLDPGDSLLVSSAPPGSAFFMSAYASNTSTILTSTHPYAALPAVLTPTSDCLTLAAPMIVCHVPTLPFVCSASGHCILRNNPTLWG